MVVDALSTEEMLPSSKIGVLNMEYKGFKIVPDGTFGMYEIRQPGSGAMPESLKGAFTSRAFATNAIDNYKPKRGAKKYAETDTAAEL